MDSRRDIVDLHQLHAVIDACRECERVVPNLLKPTTMLRGDCGNIVIVGQGPGKHEVNKGKAFSGPSGKRLNQWLIQCGASPENPRKGIYLTSVIKCVPPEEKDILKLIRKCRSFLNSQLTILRPSLVITLGSVAYDELNSTSLPYDQALCRAVNTRDHVLITPVGFHYTILAWPHPSGLNRWHNDETNQELLVGSFKTVRQHLIK